MSKLFKSEECIEAHPCRLEPVDVDAFFINNENSNQETKGTNPALGETDSETPDEDMDNAGQNSEVEDSRYDTISSGEERIDLNRLANFAGQLNTLIEGNQQPASAASDLEERTMVSGKEDPRGIEVFLENAKREADRIFSGAKNEAEELTQHAKSQANSLLEDAHSKFSEMTEGAKQHAGSILDGAKKQAGELTNSASKQAEKTINDAREQAEHTINRTRLQTEQTLNEARQQVEFIVESANRKAAELSEKAQQQAAETTKLAEQNAAGLIESTKQQTAGMLETAKQEALEIKDQAKKEGFEAGHSEGLISAGQEYESRLTQALTLLGQAEEERLTRIRSSEPELLKLAVAIAEKIVGLELKTNPETLVEIVKQALTGIPTAGSIIIKVNAGDYQLIEENLPEIQKIFREPIPVKMQQDQGVATGNCYIETDHGNIDARIKTQLEMIMMEILKAGRLE